MLVFRFSKTSIRRRMPWNETPCSTTSSPMTSATMPGRPLPSPSATVKHTGITDHDRALTTRRFAELATASPANGEIGAPAVKRLGGIQNPRTHTGLPRGKGWPERTPRPHGIGSWSCPSLWSNPRGDWAEMLQPDGDRALSVADARAWAQSNGIPFLEGQTWWPL